MIGVLLAGGLPWAVVAVFAGAAAVGLVTWAFGDKIEEENEKWAARPQRVMPELKDPPHPDDLDLSRDEVAELMEGGEPVQIVKPPWLQDRTSDD